jgi:hypothetical protein
MSISTGFAESSPECSAGSHEAINERVKVAACCQVTVNPHAGGRVAVPEHASSGSFTNSAIPDSQPGRASQEFGHPARRANQVREIGRIADAN